MGGEKKTDWTSGGGDEGAVGGFRTKRLVSSGGAAMVSVDVTTAVVGRVEGDVVKAGFEE